MSHWPFLPSPTTPHIARSEGVHFYLDNGKEILDAVGGAVVTNVGHGRAEVAEAVHRSTLKTGYILPPFKTDERVELVDRLERDWLPDYIGHVHTTCGGSEAIECAIRTAVQYHAARGKRSKTRVLGRCISYHGATMAAMEIGGHVARKNGIEHAMYSHPEVETPYPLRCPSSDPVRHYLDSLESVILSHGPDRVAAFIGEPVVGASGGAIVPPDGYWEGVDAICRKHDVLLIMDEVMTGFGRTGKKFGYQHWECSPHMLVSGKGLAGGYAPLNAVFVADEVARAVGQAGFDAMFHTYAAHPAACAAANVVLDILVREDLVGRAHVMGERLQQRLIGTLSNHPHVADVRGKGLLWGIEVVRDRTTLETFPAELEVTKKIVSHAFDNGVWFYPAGNGFVRDTICIGPPLIAEEHHLDRIVEALLEAVDEVTQTCN